MDIKATCKLDYEAVKALTYLMMFKKAEPKKRMGVYNIIMLVLIVAAALELVFFDAELPVILSAAAAALVLFYNVFMWFIYPRINYNALSRLKNVENVYEFTAEKIFISAESSDYNASVEVEYEFLLKAYETSKYLFLFQTKNQVYVVDKSTVENGTVEELRGKLFSHLGKKYVICKY